MGRDILEIVEKADMDDVKTQLVLQCAPFFTGLKISNLFMIQKRQLAWTERMLRDCGVSFEVLLETREKAAVLLYDRKAVETYLAQKPVQRILRGIGYPSFSLNVVLDRCKSRYEKYMEQQGEFPHELGLLLGYPPEDVEGFIDNRGEHFLYAGYWKVYDNLPAKKRLFGRFERATKELMQCIVTGEDIADIVSGNIKNRLHGAAV